MTPGSNTLALALRYIQPQSVWWYAYVSSSAGPDGVQRSDFAPRVKVRGSFQAVDSRNMAALGLDMRRVWAVFYVSKRLGALGRAKAGDQFGFDGRRWEVEAKTGWFAMDGWDAVLLVDIGADAGD